MKKKKQKEKKNKNERKTIQQSNKKWKDKHEKLSELEDILITKLDRGGSAVIVTVKDYIKEAEWQVSNISNYTKLQEDPTATNMKLVNDTIERLKKQNNKKVAEGSKKNDSKTPKLCLWPKIHKEGNPGCLVVSSVICHSENISKYVDYHLNP